MVVFLTFGGYKSLRCGVVNAYVLGLFILTFGGYKSFRSEVVFLTFGDC